MKLYSNRFGFPVRKRERINESADLTRPKAVAHTGYGIQIRNLVGGYTQERDILHGVDLEIAEGQTVGIIGLNGSGKSTFARAVVNALPFRRGEILFDGKDITKMTTDELSNAGIVLMMQKDNIFDELSVRENLDFAAKSKKIPDEVMELVASSNGERSLLTKRADRLSGGERRQLALALCLLREPKLLILDEPSAGLDPMAVERMYRTLQTIRQGKTGPSLLLIEQNIARAVEFCDSVNLLRDGIVARSWNDRNLGEIEHVVFN